MTLQLDTVTLLVDDVAPCVAFYRDVLGCEVRSSDATCAELALAGRTIALHRLRSLASSVGFPPMQPVGERSVLVLRTDDCDALVEHLRARSAVIVTGPRRRPGGGRSAWVRDPAGHLIELRS